MAFEERVRFSRLRIGGWRWLPEATCVVIAMLATFPTTASLAGQTPSPARVDGLASQQDAAKPAISVVVQDMTGALIPGAHVSFRNEKNQEEMNFKTDDDGALKPTALASGQYELTFASSGFCTKKIAHVTVPREGVLTVTLDIRSDPEDGDGWLVPKPPTMQPEAAPVGSKLAEPGIVARAEADRPAISMVVVDVEGAAVADADVTFRNEKSDEKTKVKTDGAGAANLASLAAGTYEVSVATRGFQTRTIPHVEIPMRERMKVTLQINANGGVVLTSGPSKPNPVHRFFSHIFQSL